LRRSERAGGRRLQGDPHSADDQRPGDDPGGQQPPTECIGVVRGREVQADRVTLGVVIERSRQDRHEPVLRMPLHIVVFAQGEADPQAVAVRLVAQRLEDAARILGSHVGMTLRVPEVHRELVGGFLFCLLAHDRRAS